MLRTSRTIALLAALAIGGLGSAQIAQAGGGLFGGIKIGGGGHQSNSADEPAPVDPWAAWTTKTYDNVYGGDESDDLYADAFTPPPTFVSGWDHVVNGLPQSPVVEGEELELVTHGMTGLLRSDAQGNGARSAELRALSSAWLSDALANGGPFKARVDAGLVAGVEFEWLHHGAATTTASECGPVVVAMLSDRCWPRALLGYMYIYDAAQLADRRARLEVEIGMSAGTVLVFDEPVLSVTDTLQDLAFVGYDQQVHGDVQVRDDLFLGTMGLCLDGDVTYGDQLEVQTMPDACGTLTQGALGVVPQLTQDVDGLRQQAMASGTYFAGEGAISEVAMPGSVVFAEGTLRVEGSFIGHATFVSATGDVIVDGMALELTGAVDRIALVAFQGDVAIAAMDSTIAGRVFCPNGAFGLHGDHTAVHGTVVARRGDVTATGARMTDGMDATAPQTARVLPTEGDEGVMPPPAEEPAPEPEPTPTGKKKKR